MEGGGTEGRIGARAPRVVDVKGGGTEGRSGARGAGGRRAVDAGGF